MHLILVRHAHAGERNPDLYPDDNLRPLSDRGREEHERVVRALSRMNLGIELVLSSPLTRARQTAEITARGLGLKGKIQLVEELGNRFSVKGLLKTLRELSHVGTVAAVGHEPYLSEFASEMLHDSGRVEIEFKKSAVLGLEFEDHPVQGRGTLLFYLPPKVVLPLVS